MAEWDYTSDVVVVGSGGGALTAALVAATHGLEVIVLEKTDLVGGSTAMSGGNVWVPNNPLMARDGVPDDEEAALNYFEAVVGDVGPASSPQRRQAFVENAPRMIEFLESLGVTFLRCEGWSDYYTDLPGASERGRTLEPAIYDTNRLGPWRTRLRPGMTESLGLVATTYEFPGLTYYNRSLRRLMVAARVQGRTWWARVTGKRPVATGTALVGKLMELALARNVTIWTAAPVTDLILEDDAVRGVVVGHEGADKRVRVRRGVLLAAAGFSRSDEMRARYNPARNARWSGSSPGETGEILERAMSLGAETALLDEAIWYPTNLMPDGSRPAYPPRPLAGMSRGRYRPGTIFVDATGQRYVNEAGSYMDIGHAMFERDAEVGAIPSWMIFDDAFRRRYIFGVVPGYLPKEWLRDGFVKRADSLGELAKSCGVDADGLAGTVKRFNEFARTGIDIDFHRGDTAYERFDGDPRIKPNNCLASIERPPFYAVAVYPGDLGTYGGLLTDAAARVLREDGQPIARLYATGNITASVMGRHYLGAGASIAAACTFGFVAMNALAADGAVAG